MKLNENCDCDTCDYLKSIHGWQLLRFKKTKGYKSLKYRYDGIVKSLSTKKEKNIGFNYYDDLKIIMLNIEH